MSIYPSSDDWVCHKHNSKLAVFRGRVKCAVVGCLDWRHKLSASDVREAPGHYAVYAALGDVFLLRNIKVPYGPADKHWEAYIDPVDLNDPNVVRNWHLFGGLIAFPGTAGLPNAAAFGSVYIHTLVGPVLDHADGLYVETGALLRDGIDLDDGGIVQHLDWLGSWSHEPTGAEIRVAKGIAVAATITSGLDSFMVSGPDGTVNGYERD